MPKALTISGMPTRISTAPMTSNARPLRTICVIGTTPDP
jgi:hypothetical protein